MAVEVDVVVAMAQLLDPDPEDNPPARHEHQHRPAYPSSSSSSSQQNGAGARDGQEDGGSTSGSSSSSSSRGISAAALAVLIPAILEKQEKQALSSGKRATGGSCRASKAGGVVAGATVVGTGRSAVAVGGLLSAQQRVLLVWALAKLGYDKDTGTDCSSSEGSVVKVVKRVVDWAVADLGEMHAQSAVGRFYR